MQSHYSLFSLRVIIVFRCHKFSVQTDLVSSFVPWALFSQTQRLLVEVVHFGVKGVAPNQSPVVLVHCPCPCSSPLCPPGVKSSSTSGNDAHGFNLSKRTTKRFLGESLCWTKNSTSPMSFTTLYGPCQ